jgi:hypothetical protein
MHMHDALIPYDRSGLIPYDVTDKRRASWIKEDGSFDVTLFKIGT